MKFRRSWIVMVSLALVLAAGPVVAQLPREADRWIGVGLELCRALGGETACNDIKSGYEQFMRNPVGPMTMAGGRYQPRAQHTPMLVADIFSYNGQPTQAQVGVLLTGPTTARYTAPNIPPTDMQYRIERHGQMQLLHLLDWNGNTRITIELWYMNPVSGELTMHLFNQGSIAVGLFQLLPVGY